MDEEADVALAGEGHEGPDQLRVVDGLAGAAPQLDLHGQIVGLSEGHGALGADQGGQVLAGLHGEVRLAGLPDDDRDGAGRDGRDGAERELGPDGHGLGHGRAAGHRDGIGHLFPLRG